MSAWHGDWASAEGLPSGSLSVFDTGYLIVDGHVVEQLSFEEFASSRAVDVPALYAHVSHEGIGSPILNTLAQYHDFVARTFTKSEEVLQLYPANTDKEAQHSSNTLLADITSIWPTWKAARSQARNLNSPVWYYKFERSVPISQGADFLEKDDCASHGANTLYGFGKVLGSQVRSFPSLMSSFLIESRPLEHSLGGLEIRILASMQKNGLGYSWVLYL